PSVQVIVLSGSISISLSGPVLYAFQTSLPVLMSYAVIRPRTPNSPPLIPVRTLSLKTCGALVAVSPIFGLPVLTFQTSLPLLASSATSVVSACCRNTFPSAYATPRLTVSQHITGITLGSCFGSYFHLIFWSSRLSANTLLGNGLCTYIVSPTTNGPPSWPRSTPVEKVHATVRFLALSLLICFSSL